MWNYFRHETIEEVEENFKKGDVLSGLTAVNEEGTTEPDHAWYVYKKGGTVKHDGHEAE